METGLMEFRGKEIINIKNGDKIGYADDVLFDTVKAQIISLVVYGRLRFFGLFGRQDDIEIPWGDIEIIGEDTILVKTESMSTKKHTAQKVSVLKQLLS